MNIWLALIKATLIFIIAILMSSSVVANPIKKFHHISREDGLTSDSVFMTLEDDNGFIWFATANGLQRFDGNEVVSFRDDMNKVVGSPINESRAIVFDRNKTLWIGTDAGLLRYDISKEKFTRVNIETSIERISNTRSNNIRIRALHLSDNNILWIGSYYGLTSYHIETKQVNHYNLPTIRSIKEISSDQFLLGTLGNGLFEFSPETGVSKKLFNKGEISLKRYGDNSSLKNFDYAALSNISIINIFVDDANDIYLSTWGLGLIHLDSEFSLIGRIPVEGNPMFIQKLLKDENGNFWMSSNEALYHGSEGIKKLKLVSKNTGTEIDIATAFRDISLTKNSKLLISTFGFGVFVHNYLKGNFESFRVPESNDVNYANSVTELTFLNHNLLAISTMSNKLWLYNLKTQAYRYLITPEALSSLGINKVNKVSEGELRLYADWSEAVYHLNYDKENLLTKPAKKIDQTRYTLIGNSGDRDLLLGKDNKTDFLVLLKWNNLGFTEPVAHSNIKIPPGIIDCGCTWISKEDIVISLSGMPVMRIRWTNNRLNIVDSSTFTIPTSSALVYYDDAKLMVVTRDLGIFQAPANDFKSLTKINTTREFHDVVTSLYNSKSHEVWLGTLNGLYRFNLSNQEWKLFDEFDGLPSSEFNWPRAIDKNGLFYLGTAQGFIRFDPNQTNHKTTPLHVNLTKLIINNTSVSPNSASVLKTSISSTESLELLASQNSLALEFSAPTLPIEQRRLTYSYILDGFDTSWREVDYKKRVANYTNLPHGDYTFRVKVKNKNGVWSENDRTLAISISPPWWLTTWAYIAYTLIIAFVFYAVIQYRTIALTRRSKALEKEVSARTKEVEQLLEKQNREFANISHEFRTPLTLILGPIANVLKKLNPKTQPNEIKQLETTQRNSYRLLRMVDQLLNIESFQVKSIIQKQPIAFGETTRLIADGFVELAKEKQCEFAVEKIEDINFEFTPDAYEKILLNLLSNAFKYTPANGTIRLKTWTNKNEFMLKVSDTGIGIPKDEQATIFERFNRSTNINQENAPGAGIGLSLVKNLVELHQGQIQLESEPQIGTSFTVILPIINPTNNAELIYRIDESMIDVEMMTLAAQSHAPQKISYQASEQSNQRETILVIEDNDDMREYIKESIAQTYTVITASDGEQGVQIAINEIPDLIISDIMMPKLDGYQVTSQLRQNTATSHIPIVLLTAKDDKVSRMKGWHEKADEYLTKPFDINELNIRVKSLLEIRDLLKQRFADSVFKKSKVTEVEDQSENQEQLFINNLNKILEEVYQDQQIKVSELSTKVAMSDRQLLRKLKSTVDMTPTEYLRKYRLERAKDLLAKGESVTNTAFKVGFTSSSYFTNCFKAYVGIKPSEFVSSNNKIDTQSKQF